MKIYKFQEYLKEIFVPKGLVKRETEKEKMHLLEWPKNYGINLWVGLNYPRKIKYTIADCDIDYITQIVDVYMPLVIINSNGGVVDTQTINLEFLQKTQEIKNFKFAQSKNIQPKFFEKEDLISIADYISKAVSYTMYEKMLTAGMIKGTVEDRIKQKNKAEQLKNDLIRYGMSNDLVHES